MMGSYKIEKMHGDFYQKRPFDKIWWTDSWGKINGRWDIQEGELLFSFDKKTIYNLYRDYPHNLTPEQKRIFDKENPFWAEYFGQPVAKHGIKRIVSQIFSGIWSKIKSIREKL